MFVFGELLRGFRQRHGMTQHDLADLLGVHRNSISDWERSVYLPDTPEMVRDLSDALTLSPSETDQLLRAAQYPTDAASQPASVATAPPGHHELHRDWGEAPNVDIFYGRAQERETLAQWLTGDRCRLISVMGMGGIGKTTLATKVAADIADDYPFLLWCSLRNAPPVEEILAEAIRFFSNQEVAELPTDTDRRITLLLGLMRRQRCLLILDNVEAVLRGGEGAGHYRSGYEGYGHLFRRAGETEHQSCLLLTSREKPRDVALLEGTGRSIASLDLATLDLAAGRAILQQGGLAGTDADWATLVERYSGNPLALKLIAETVRELFDGDIAAFLGEEVFIFGEVAHLLDEQFGRLSDLEQSLLVWLAVEREAVGPDHLRRLLFQPVSRRDLLEALLGLRRRSLVESNGAGFTLQNVVMEFLTERLIGTVCREIESDEAPTTLPAPWWFSRHALMEAQAKEYVRASQIRLILQPIGDRLLARFGEAALMRRFKDLLALLRRRPRRQQGYMAGNLFNLLRTLGYELSGWDFSDLAVWQANLQGIRLQDVDFSGSDLQGALCTDTFGNVNSVTYCPQGQLFAAATSSGQICLWDAADGQPVMTLEGHIGEVLTVAFSPDGQFLASGGHDQWVRLWDIANLRRSDSPRRSATRQPIKILRGHTNVIWSAVFSPDGRTVATACADQTVRLWDVANLPRLAEDAALDVGQCVAILEGHTNGVLTAAFSPDGRTLASGSGDHTVRLWDVADPDGSVDRPASRILAGHSGAVWAVTFSPDGKILASGSKDQTVCLWNLAESDASGGMADMTGGTPCATFAGHHAGWIMSMAFSPDGQLLATGSTDQMVRLWDMTNPSGLGAGQPLKILAGHTDWVQSVAISPDGRTLVSGSTDQTVRLWSIAELRGSGAVHAIKTLVGYTNEALTVAFSPDGRHLATGSTDQSVRLWDVNALLESDAVQPLKTLAGHAGWVNSVAFSPDGNTLASGSTDQTVRLWDVRNPDGADDAVQLATRRCMNSLTGHTHGVKSVAFSADGLILASGGGDQTVRLWAVAGLAESDAGQCLEIVAGFRQEVMAVAFRPALPGERESMRTLACGSYDRTIRLWDAVEPDSHELSNGDDSDRSLFLLTDQASRVESVAFSPDGHLLASGGDDQSIRLWSIGAASTTVSDRGQQIQVLSGHTDRVNAVAFSPDGRSLASGSFDRTIRLWDVSDPHAPESRLSRKTLIGHTNEVNAIAFSPDGRLLASSSRDETIRLWDVDSGECLTILRPDRPYERMNIAGVTGMAAAQATVLKALGAIEAI